MNIEEARKNLKVGDRVRVDGYGSGPGNESVEPTPMTRLVVGRIMRGDFEGHDDNGKWVADFRRSSIIEVIPAEPKPKVGEWRCGNHADPNAFHSTACPDEWYRSTGWSKDERTGDRCLELTLSVLFAGVLLSVLGLIALVAFR